MRSLLRVILSVSSYTRVRRQRLSNKRARIRSNRQASIKQNILKSRYKVYNKSVYIRNPTLNCVKKEIIAQCKYNGGEALVC